MIDWKPEAIDAAAHVLRADIKDSAWNTDDEIRTALNAAVAKQFARVSDVGMVYSFECGLESGRIQGAAERDALRALLRECRSGWYLNEELNARIDSALKGDDRE